MYESPIQITQIGEQIGTELVEQEEAYIFSVVNRIYADVDKDELIKALAYDRGQYEKGYSDGRAARDAEIVRCKDCKYWKTVGACVAKFCTCIVNTEIMKDEDDYCSLGERRTDDAET
jgi:hypothetical protein